MKALVRSRGVLVCLQVVFLGNPLVQGQSQRVPETDVPIRTTARLVLAPAIVRDRSGEFVSGLSSEDFELMDNGVAQTLRVEQTKGQPVALVVVMQTGDGALQEFQN